MKKCAQANRRWSSTIFEPIEALRLLAAFTFEHHSKHPDFIRLVMIENIHNGAFYEQVGADPKAQCRCDPKA